MNEELKIIIRAVTDTAKKSIEDVNNKLKETGATAQESGAKVTKSFKNFKAGALVAVAAIGAVIGAIVSLGKSTKEFREQQAKLNTAFLAAGSTSQQAAKSYSNLYRFLGDSSKATEAAGHLAKLTTNEQELAEWTTALQGVYASYGDSLPIEGLTEAANETAKVGKVTGTLADALNWAGVNEDAFNASLAVCTTETERQNVIRNTLNDTYAEAAKLYEKNNKEIIKQNEAQARLDNTTAKLGKTIQPLLTALTNLSNTLLTALAPAIEVIAKALTWLVEALNKAISWIMAFFSALGGKSGAVTEVADGVGQAANNASGLQGAFDKATESAEKLKRATMGFDELNVVSSDNSNGNSGGGGAGSSATGGFTVDTSGVDNNLTKTSKKFEEFVNKVKNKLKQLEKALQPTIQAFKDLFGKIGEAIKNNLPTFQEGLESHKQGLGSLLSYLIDDFIPNFTNAWSENVLPIFGDVLAFAIEELAETFKTLGATFQDVIENIIKPALDIFKNHTTEALQSVKKAWDENGGELLANLKIFFDGLRSAWDKFYKEVLEPVGIAINNFVDDVWKESLQPLWDKLVNAIMSIANDLTIFWNEVLKPIFDWIASVIYPIIVKVFNKILDKVKGVTNIIAGVIGGIVDVIKGVIAFITGVFTGRWEKAWNGIKDIFSGVWDIIWSILKGVINLIIDGINKLWSGIYKAVKGIVDTIGKVAGVIGSLLGQNWNFSMPEQPPLIPKLATGGIVNSATVAMIGEAGREAVLPLDNNTEWMDKLADKIASRNGTPSKIVLQLDGKELGWANINSINSITKETGTLQLQLV